MKFNKGVKPMRKRLLSVLLSLVLLLALVPTVAYATTYDANSTAQSLYQLGLFNGIGKDAEGNPNFDLDRAPTRYEAVMMLVRLLGKADEAQSQTWDTPFTYVVEWAKPYVGYAYAHGLTSGTSATTFGGAGIVTPVQYITFVLRALGYKSGTDFQWDKSYELSNKLGFTVEGVYNNWGAYNIEKSVTGSTVLRLRDFVRGDMAIISNSALFINIKGTDTTLLEQIMSVPGAGEHTHSYKTYQIPHYGQTQIGTSEVVEDIKYEFYECGGCHWATEDRDEFDKHMGLGDYAITPCSAYNWLIRYATHPSVTAQPIYKTQWIETAVRICEICGQQEVVAEHTHN